MARMSAFVRRVAAAAVRVAAATIRVARLARVAAGAPIAMTLCVLATLGSTDTLAMTHELDIRTYCAPGSNCGFPSSEAMRLYILDTVQEVNLQWEYMGISFKPVNFPVVEDNYFSEVQGCNDEEPSNTRRGIWRFLYAYSNPGAVTLMLTQGGNWCCAPIPNASLPPPEQYGAFCFLGSETRSMGGVWAHELGHYFCLPHTFTGQDSADTAPNVPFWDGDDASGVHDTNEDPGRYEDYALDPDTNMPYAGLDEDVNNVPIDGHQWCDWTELTPNFSAFLLSDDSPHDTKCVPQCRERVMGVTQPLAISTEERWAMSYFDSRCHGPYVLNGGARYETFSPDSRDVATVTCKAQFPAERDLADVCATHGGDTDFDGICDWDDGCPNVRNTAQRDTDADGVDDACDLCPLIPSQQGDIDGDGIGDECDNDKDGDGCANDVDQHPDSSTVIIGSSFTGCGFGTEPIVGYEWGDTDGDGVIDCLDLDDDDDGICDDGGMHDETEPGVPPGGCDGGPNGKDYCPQGGDGPQGTGCMLQGSPVDCPDPWINCLGGTCVELFLKFVSVINPAEQFVVDQFQIFGDTLYLSKLPNRTVSELGLGVQGEFQAVGVQASSSGLTSGPDAALRTSGMEASALTPGTDAIPPVPSNALTSLGDPIRLEIWSKRTNTLVSVVGEYSAGDVTLLGIDRGRFLAMTPVFDDLGRIIEMRIGATYARGAAPGVGGLPDADMDARPDFTDRCLLVPDFEQQDADGDGFGDLCDPDVDQDLMVTPADVAAVMACEGADLTLQHVILEPPAEYNLSGPGPAAPSPDVLARAVSCRAMDLDGDRDVDMDDTAIAQTAVGGRPGPSGLSAGTSPCGASCDDGNACTQDYCDPLSGQCVNQPRNCDDGVDCTIDTCDAGTGQCVSTPASCDDGNPCTDDQCDFGNGGACTHTPAAPGTQCDDGNLCTTGDTCVGSGSVCAGNPVVCDDGDVCTADSCDPSTGLCQFTGNGCDDGNPCTSDTCSPTGGGCLHSNLPDLTPCSDGDACTDGEVCRFGQCGGAVPLNCDDGDICTVDLCDPTFGCTTSPLNCDDGSACTVDMCDPAQGGCVNAPVTVGDPTPLEWVDALTFAWPLTVGPKHWNTYRGTIPPGGMGSRLPGAEYDHSCFESADFLFDGATTSHDFSTPPLGWALYYATTEEVDCTEGPPGFDHNGVARPLIGACITPP